MNEDKFRIITETDTFFVIYKPAGLLLHAAPGKNKITLVDLIKKHFPAIESVGDDPVRPGIVHRLDQDVSGLLVIAKTQAMFEHLKSQFKSRQTRKIYQALVFNKIKEPKGEISLPIGRSGRGVKMSVNYGKDLKPALTRYEVLENYIFKKQTYSLVRIELKTGRTHQIRIHFQSQGHPLVGDTLYKIKRIKQPENFGRIFLQAVELGFKDLDNKEQNFKIELDQDLQDLLKQFQKDES